MQIQVPSQQLNDFLKDPNGGETIHDVGEIVAPILDMREFLYKGITYSKQFSASGITSDYVAIIPGIYRIRGSVAGYVNITAGGIFTLNVNIPSASGGTAIHVIKNVSCPAATTVDVSVLFDIILENSNLDVINLYFRTITTGGAGTFTPYVSAYIQKIG